MIISFYTNVKNTTKQKDISIDEFIEMVRNGAVKKEIEALRKASQKKEQKDLKMALPCVTASGTFKGNKTDKDLLKHSGFMQIDFDDIENIEVTRKALELDKYTFCCFLSPTGTGLKLLVKIPASVETHKASFLALEKYYLNSYSLPIDTACKNVSRTFFLSFDENAFVNKQAVLFENLAKENTKQPLQTPPNYTPKTTTQEQVERVISQLAEKQIDLTEPYENFIKIGFALASEFGEQGRNYFHSVCELNSKYETTAINKQYTESLKNRKQGITIASLFYLAQEHGINLNPVKETAPTKSRPVVNNSDKPISKFEQVEKYLSSQYDFRYNTISNEVEQKLKDEIDFKKCEENNIYRELQLNSISFSLANLNALLNSDFVREYNPINQYFDTLPIYNPATEPDYIGLLCSYVSAKEQNRFNVHFRKMLVRSIACSLDGVFNKQAFILVHDKQSSGKSYFCRWLCPEILQKYFVENINADKDSLIALAQNFIINLDELASMSRQDINTLKSYFSKDKIKVRLPYARTATTIPRKANFVGSTNTFDFLTDTTGSVRWLCFEIKYINWDYKNDIEIHSIWSQALYLYKTGFKYQLSENELAENEKANEDFTQIPMEQELFTQYFEKGTKEDDFYTTTQIFTYISARVPNSNKMSSAMLGRCLRKLGFEKVNRQYDKGYYLKIRPNGQ